MIIPMFFHLLDQEPFSAKNDSQVYFCRSLSLAYVQVGTVYWMSPAEIRHHKGFDHNHPSSVVHF